MIGRVDVLSRSQENEIWVEIQRLGLTPFDFVWTSHEGAAHDVSDYHTLTHKPTQSYLEFSLGSSAGHWLTWRPMSRSGSRAESASEWTKAKSLVLDWLKRVKEDHEAPDLWGSLNAQHAIPNAANQATKSEPFSPGEMKLLENGLDDIERYVITTQSLDPAERDEVTRRFTYLREAARSGVRKVDWLNIFVGQVVSMVTEGLLKPSFYAPLMSHASTALNSLFQFGIKLLQTPAG